MSKVHNYTPCTHADNKGNIIKEAQIGPDVLPVYKSTFIQLGNPTYSDRPLSPVSRLLVCEPSGC